jgi:hypothetical protein
MAQRAWKHSRSILLDQRGVMSLIELLVADPITLAVFGATLGLYDLAVRSQSRHENRVRALIDQKNGLERMSRELRTAISVKYQTNEIVDAQLSPSKRWVRYDCSPGSCKRSEGPSQGVFDKGPVVTVPNVLGADFQMLADAPPLGLQPNYVNPSYMTVTLRVTAKGSNNPIVLNDGFDLRNLTTLG